MQRGCSGCSNGGDGDDDEDAVTSICFSSSITGDLALTATVSACCFLLVAEMEPFFSCERGGGVGGRDGRFRGLSVRVETVDTGACGVKSPSSSSSPSSSDDDDDDDDAEDGKAAEIVRRRLTALPRGACAAFLLLLVVVAIGGSEEA